MNGPQLGITDERDGERGSRDGVGDHEQEDGEREQYGDAERDLLTGVGRQQEPDQDQRRQHEAGHPARSITDELSHRSHPALS